MDDNILADCLNSPTNAIHSSLIIGLCDCNNTTKISHTSISNKYECGPRSENVEGKLQILSIFYLLFNNTGQPDEYVVPAALSLSSCQLCTDAKS